MDFGDYIRFYNLARSEGTVLRYLSDVYKTLLRTIPEERKSDELVDLTEWLGELVRQVDSSLLDEWEELRNPAPPADDGADLDPDSLKERRASEALSVLSGMPPAGAFFFGASTIAASVVISRPDTEAASCRAVRTTLAGSMTPSATRSTYCSV